VLGGAIFGDHCSPISDTTIMASMSSACDHIAHVKTQLPYALAIQVICLILYVLGGFISSWWVLLLIGAVSVLAVVRYVGKPVGASNSKPSSDRIKVASTWFLGCCQLLSWPWQDPQHVGRCNWRTPGAQPQWKGLSPKSLRS